MIDLSSIDFVELCERLGLRNARMTSGGVEVSYSCHRAEHTNNDESPSAYVNSNTGLFMCHGCKFHGSVVILVADVQQVPRVTAERWLRDTFGIEFNEPVGGSMAAETEARFRPMITPSSITRPPESYLSGVRLDWSADPLEPFQHYMLERGLSRESLTDWDIGYDYLSNRITIPVRDLDGKLAGIKGRDWCGSHPAKYCNTPDAPIWMDDMTFKLLADVQVGDAVMGWAPGIPVKGRWGEQTAKQLVPSVVTNKIVRGPVPVVRIYLESGRTIRCTSDHQWLQHRGRGGGGRPHDIFGTAEVDKLISSIVIPRSHLSGQLERDALWLGGLFDGEGSSNDKATVISQSRSHNPDICNRIESVLFDLGIEWGYDNIKGGGSYRIKGGWQSIVDLANWCEPVRRHHLARRVLGKTYFKTPDRIVAIEPDGDSEVVSLQTETGNYVAWGYASKNCVVGDRPGSSRLRYGFGTYEVSEVVFGLHRALDTRWCVLVEGELDAIALSQMGIPRPIASNGSNFSQRQARLIVDECEEVVVMYDAGAAGEVGTARVVEALEPYVRVRVAEPLDVDPCDALRIGAQLSVLEAIERAEPSLVRSILLR